MDRMLYVVASGAKQIQQAMAANNNNLANVNTVGFQADLDQFRSMPVYGPGQPSRVYAMAEPSGVDATHGSLISTGRSLDVAVKGDGWIAVQAPDGSEAYTRAGDLKVSAAGILTTGAGYPVMGNGGPLAVPPSQKIEIGGDGTVSVRPLGQAPNTLAVLDRIKLVKPDPRDLVKGNDGLLHMRNGGTAPADASVQLSTGTLESSNVDPVTAMVNMIQMARQFDTQVQMMRTAKDDDAASAKLMQLA